jgi:diphosphomevalonate decarboxylase
MKATAVAPANIAFIKYWGKRDEKLRLPLNSSFSMNLTGSYTTTTVEFSSSYSKDEVSLLHGNFSEKEITRVIDGLKRIRLQAGIHEFARVITQNTFPKGAGAAASASGFAALSMAGAEAAGVSLSEKELTILARLGSGSACRSIPDGFVLWEKGTTSEDSYAYSIYPSTYWDLRDILVIVDSHMKKIPTTEGMENIQTSPNLGARLQAERIFRNSENL